MTDTYNFASVIAIVAPARLLSAETAGYVSCVALLVIT